MIFSIGNHIEQIKQGIKTQTRRTSDYYCYIGHTFAIQPCRTCKGISEGRIQIIDYWIEDRTEYPNLKITVDDAKAEGNYTPNEFEALYSRMYPNWKTRIAYKFKYVPTKVK